MAGLSPTRFFRKDYKSLDPYAPVKPLDVLAEEIGCKIEDLVKLDANENLYGPVPEITSALASCDVYHIYPDPSQTYLRRDLSAFLGCGIKPEHICAGTGSDELIDLVFRLFDPKAIINLPPTFGMYPFLSKICKTEVLTVDRGPSPSFALDYASIRTATAAGASVIFVASPNNPTGGMLSHEEVSRLCSLEAIVVIDEAYAEFSAPGASAASLVHKHDNLIVLRTFSKWAGLAGLRVGYAVAHADTITGMMAIKQPYNVNVAADYGARAALAAEHKIMTTQVQPMVSERDRMTKELAAMGWMWPVPTDSNFVLFEVARPFVAAEIVAALRRRGILVRYYPGGRLAGFIRISAGRPQDTDRLLAAMKAIGAEQAAAHGTPVVKQPISCLLWDMDGVLVEVAGSYRAAIIATAKLFGVDVTHADIDAIKAAGGANNDWLVTLRLIKEKGSSGNSAAQTATIEGVTAAFEKLYQGDGTPANPGLKSTESALIDRAALETLKARMPGGMAVVTGRPRADAAEAIKRYGWEGVFDAVVCMEDGPAKPDPAPIHTAIQRLQAAYESKHLAGSSGSTASSQGAGAGAMPSHAVASAPQLTAELVKSVAAEAQAIIRPECSLMIGDTVDDIRAAVAAGALGIGAYPPDKSPAKDAGKADKLKASLAAAGAIATIEPGCAALLAHLAPRESAAALFANNLRRLQAWATGARATAAATATASASGSQRTGSCSRVTKETSISAWVDLDGTGASDISTGLGFLDHMLSAFSKHGHIDVKLHCKGDLHIDDHHTAEDCALALGEAVDKALGARKDIRRWGSALCPLDEALSRAVIDISSRPHSEIDLQFTREKVGDISCEMLTHVFHSFAATARITLHVDVLKGSNNHHKAEASFKALGVALREAVSIDKGGIPSTKGVLA